DGGQELVAKSALARGNLLTTWQTSERNAHQGQDYEKIRLEETTFRGHPAVVWEYRFTLKGVPWHARLLGFNVGGTSFQINTWYRAADEPGALEVYERVKKTLTVLLPDPGPGPGARDPARAEAGRVTGRRTRTPVRGRV